MWKKWYIVGEFVGSEVFFPTPDEFARTESNHVKGGPSLVYDTNAHKKGDKGLHNAGMCQLSRFFPNAFKIGVRDKAHKVYYVLITSGAVVSAGEELVYYHVPSVSLHMDLYSLGSVLMMGKGPRREELDALIAFIRTEYGVFRYFKHLSSAPDSEMVFPLDATWMNHAKWFAMRIRVTSVLVALVHNPLVYRMVSQRLPGEKHQSFIQDLVFVKKTMRTFFSPSLQDRQVTAMLPGSSSFGDAAAQRAIFSILASATSGTEQAFSASVHGDTFEQETRVWDDLVTDSDFRKALWRKDWEKLLQYEPWVQRIKMPTGFFYKRAQDRDLVLQLKVFVRYCYRMLSYEGDAHHYVKAVCFLEGLKKIQDKVAADVGCGLVARYDFSAVNTIEELAKCIAYGLRQSPEQAEVFYQMITPSLCVLSNRQVEMVDKVVLQNAMVKQDGLEAFWCMVSFSLKKMRAFLTNYRNGLYHDKGRNHKEHKGMQAFYHFMGSFLHPYVFRYASPSLTGNDLAAWRKVERSANVRQLWQPLPEQLGQSQLRGQSLFTDNAFCNAQDGWVMVPPSGLKG